MTKKTREKLLKLFLTQAALARFLDIPQSNVCVYFSGLVIWPLRHAFKISKHSMNEISMKELGHDDL